MNQTPIVSLPHTHTHSQSPTDRTRPCPCRCWQFGSSHHAGHTISVKYWSVWKWIVSVLFGSCFYCRLGCFSQPAATYAGITANKKKTKKISERKCSGDECNPLFGSPNESGALHTSDRPLNGQYYRTPNIYLKVSHAIWAVGERNECFSCTIFEVWKNQGMMVDPVISLSGHSFSKWTQWILSGCMCCVRISVGLGCRFAAVLSPTQTRSKTAHLFGHKVHSSRFAPSTPQEQAKKWLNIFQQTSPMPTTSQRDNKQKNSAFNHKEDDKIYMIFLCLPSAWKLTKWATVIYGWQYPQAECVWSLILIINLRSTINFNMHDENVCHCSNVSLLCVIPLN